MKKTLTLLFLAAAFLTVKAQKTEIFENDIMFKSPYAIDDNTVTTNAIVTYGKVTEVVLRKDVNGAPYYFINLEKKRYDNPVTLLVFKNNYSGNFDLLNTLIDKTIIVSGKIEFRKALAEGSHAVKPNIAIYNPNQIKIITDFK